MEVPIDYRGLLATNGEAEEGEIEEGEYVPQQQFEMGQAGPGTDGQAPVRLGSKRRQQKKKAKLVAQGKGNMNDYYDIYGPNARAEIELKPPAHSEQLIRLQDVSGLVTWTLADGVMPPWVFVKNKPLVSKVVVLYAAGLDPILFSARPDLFPCMKTLFDAHRISGGVEPTADVTSTAGILLSIPTPKKRKAAEGADAGGPSSGVGNGSGAVAGSTTAPQVDEPQQKRRKVEATGEADGSEEKKRGLSEEATSEGARSEGVPTRIRADVPSEVPAEAAAVQPEERPGVGLAVQGATADGAVDERNGIPGSTEKPSTSAPAVGNGKSGGRAAEGAPRPSRGAPVFSKRRKSGPPPFPPSYYVLSEVEMQENGYPALLPGTPPLPLPGFVQTRPSAELLGTKKRHVMVAVDCEMCYTDAGLELTRVTLVSAKGKVLLDKLVKPTNPIRDYNTKFSGITAEMLQGVTTTLEDIQAELVAVVSKETILVGHSLQSDLNALKLVHTNNIDTSLAFSHPRGPPFKPALRVLAERFLKRTIQSGDKGHDSVEDARATMDLAQLKIQNGPSFGEPRPIVGESLIEALGRKGKRCALIDRRRLLHRFAVGTSAAVIAESDGEVVAKCVKEARNPTNRFVWARLAELSAHQEEASRDPAAVASSLASMSALLTCTSGAAEVAVSPVSPTLEAVLQRMDARVQAIYDGLPPNALLVVATGHGDTATVRKLMELKFKGLQAASTGAVPWTEDRDKVLNACQYRAKLGLVLAKVRH